MNKQLFTEFIKAKTGRQAVLEDRRKTLEDLEVQITASKISTSFQGFYYFIKRYLVLFLAFILLFAGILFLIYPDIVFSDENVKDTILKEYKLSYYLEAEDKFSDGLVSAIKNGDESVVNAFMEGIDDSIEKTAEKDVLALVKLLAVFVLFMSVILWYISRLTKKLQKRNALIKSADSLAKDILLDYKNTIEEEAKELKMLKQLLKETIG